MLRRRESSSETAKILPKYETVSKKTHPQRHTTRRCESQAGHKKSFCIAEALFVTGGGISHLLFSCGAHPRTPRASLGALRAFFCIDPLGAGVLFCGLD